MAIRYDKSLNKEINRVVRNFNSKIKRLEKAKKDLILPEMVSVKNLKNTYKSRSDLYRELTKLQGYSKRGIEETIKTMGGAEVSRYELQNIKREARRLKYQLTRQINVKKTTKPKVFGVTQDVTFAEMGDVSFLNLLAKRESLDKDIEKLTSREFTRYKDVVSKSTSNKYYDVHHLQYNWANEMLIPLGYMTGYPLDKLEEVTRKLASMKEEEFLRAYDEEMIFRAIVDLYREAMRGNEDMSEDVNPILDELTNTIDDIIEQYEK